MNIEDMDDYRVAAKYIMGEALSKPDPFMLRALKALMDRQTFLESRQSPNTMYDSDFGRITGTKRP